MTKQKSPQNEFKNFNINVLVYIEINKLSINDIGKKFIASHLILIIHGNLKIIIIKSKIKLLDSNSY